MSVVICLSGKKPCDRWLIWNIICAEHKFNKEKEGGGSRIHWENLYVWGRQFSSLIRKKKPRHKPQQLRKDRSLCCIIWQETSTVLSDRGVRMIGRTRAHTRAPTNTHTHTHCLYFLLFSLVCFPSRDEPLADRTGPLGSCYRPPQRTDWKALIAALRSPQSRENRSLSVIGSLSWDAGKRVNEGAKRENERQVRHPVRVNYWEKKRRRERGWQRLSNRQFQSERNHESLCLAVFTLFTRKDSSRYWWWHMSGFWSQSLCHLTDKNPGTQNHHHQQQQRVSIFWRSQWHKQDFRWRQQQAFRYSSVFPVLVLFFYGRHFFPIALGGGRSLTLQSKGQTG